MSDNHVVTVVGTSSEAKVFVYILKIVGNGKVCRECVLYATPISSYSIRRMSMKMLGVI